MDGWTRLEYCSFDTYNEAGNLQQMTERFREREGHYPQPYSGGQDIPKLRESQILQGTGHPSLRPDSEATQKG